MADWERSETRDMLWAARKQVLTMASTMEELMDVIDPIGCERQGLDRYGEPIEREGDTYTTLDFLYIWVGKLRTVNSALREVSFRLEVDGDEDTAALPDTL